MVMMAQTEAGTVLEQTSSVQDQPAPDEGCDLTAACNP